MEKVMSSTATLLRLPTLAAFSFWVSLSLGFQVAGLPLVMAGGAVVFLGLTMAYMLFTAGRRHALAAIAVGYAAIFGLVVTSVGSGLGAGGTHYVVVDIDGLPQQEFAAILPSDHVRALDAMAARAPSSDTEFLLGFSDLAQHVGRSALSPSDLAGF